MDAQPKAAVVLGGGAPNSALMAGALAAIYDNNKTFNEFYTSGAGAVIGLVYLAARRLTPSEALRLVTRVGVDDAIYKWVPLGYKTFFKRGPWTVPFQRFGNRFKLSESFFDPDFRRLYNDLIDLAVAAVTPTSLTPSCDALCAHYPFLHEVIDFDKLKQFNGKFFMNSYCIDKGQPEQFDEDQIGPEHFYAALSYPFIYPPTRIGNCHYYEGAAHDPLNLPRSHRLCCKGEIGLLAVFDVLGAFQQALIRRPRNLLDAYGISILMSVVAMAQKDMKRFADFHKRHQKQAETKSAEKERTGEKRGPHTHRYDLELLKFEVPRNDYATICDWSYSNLERLWHIGYESGSRFVEKFRDKLPDHRPDSPDPVSPA